MKARHHLAHTALIKQRGGSGVHLGALGQAARSSERSQAG